MSTFLYGGNVQANGIRQHYLRYGGKGPALILIPGITSPAITWGFVAERLGAQFDTYVLDVRGRGLSSTGPELDYSADTCAEDIGAFADALNLQRYHLVGHAEAMRAFCATWTTEQLQLRAEWLHTCYEPAIVRAFNDFHTVDFHQHLPSLKAPALLMVAGRGGVILDEDITEIQDLQPAIQVARVPNAGHMIPWDDFDGFFHALGDFLEQ